VLKKPFKHMCDRSIRMEVNANEKTGKRVILVMKLRHTSSYDWKILKMRKKYCC